MNRFTEFKVCVNKDDIRLGKRTRAARCPVARATKRSLKAKGHKVKLVLITSCAEIRIEDREVYECRLPREALKFGALFDNKKPVKPVSFVIKIPTKTLTTPYNPWKDNTDIGW